VNYGQCLTYQWMASVLKSHDRLVCWSMFEARRTWESKLPTRIWAGTSIPFKYIYRWSRLTYCPT
jgi:hypothetical protein